MHVKQLLTTLTLVINCTLNCLEISDQCQVTIKPQVLKWMIAQTNAYINLIQCHATGLCQWTWVWSFNTTHAYNVYKESRSGTYIKILSYSHLSARSFSQLEGSKCSSSSLASIPICNPLCSTQFQYTPKRWLSVLFGAKRTFDSNLAPQNCLGSIHSSLGSHLSSHETSNECTVCGATFCNVFSVHTYSRIFCMGIFAK